MLSTLALFTTLTPSLASTVPAVHPPPSTMHVSAFLSLVCLLALLSVFSASVCRAYDVSVYTSTSLAHPLSVVSDGDQYIYSTGGLPTVSAVVRLAIDGKSEPLFFNGSSVQMGAYSQGLAMDPTLETVYVADVIFDRVLAFNTTGGLQRVVASGKLVESPLSLAVDSIGNIHVGTGRRGVVKLSPEGEQLRNWTASLPYRVDDVAVDSAGYVYVASLSCEDCVMKLSPTSDEVVQNFTTTNPSMRACPRGVAVDGAGNVFISDFSNRRIVKLSANGTLLDVYNTTGAVANATLFPYGLSIDSKGSLWAADNPSPKPQPGRIIEFVGVAVPPQSTDFSLPTSSIPPSPSSRFTRSSVRLD